ncbi:hypothetical protein [Alphaproteobacteria bacterium endosymbiont of Tiliacea citrago]|uniref:hypothetical protein n=1 Tax=Alphaproteobacteria bacterium endosymbiont of Tiliacea citrago TaxID=3077944 RepID=UPI00313C27B6
MNFHYFYSKILTFVDYLKKKKIILLIFLGFVFAGGICLYLKHSFELESSSAYLDYISGKSEDFLKNKQFGFYERIRQIILEKDKEKKEIKKLAQKNDLFKKYLKFLNQLDGIFGDDFDSILEASEWRNLLILSKIFYGKSFQEGKTPFFLNVLIQYKGEKK